MTATRFFMISSRLVVRQQRFVGNFVEPFKTNLDQKRQRHEPDATCPATRATGERGARPFGAAAATRNRALCGARRRLGGGCGIGRRHGDGARCRGLPALRAGVRRSGRPGRPARPWSARRSFAGRASGAAHQWRRRERAAHPVGIGTARRRSCRRAGGKAVRRRLAGRRERAVHGRARRAPHRRGAGRRHGCRAPGYRDRDRAADRAASAADGGEMPCACPSRWPTRSPISASRQQPRPPTSSRPATISRSSTWQAGNARTSNASRRASSTRAWSCRSMPR